VASRHTVDLVTLSEPQKEEEDVGDLLFDPSTPVLAAEQGLDRLRRAEPEQREEITRFARGANDQLLGVVELVPVAVGAEAFDESFQRSDGGVEVGAGPRGRVVRARHRCLRLARLAGLRGPLRARSDLLELATIRAQWSGRPRHGRLITDEGVVGRRER
jgi:hypothetical protein